MFHQSPEDNALEHLGPWVHSIKPLLKLAFPLLRFASVFDEAMTIISRPKVGIGVEAVDDPHLVPGAACRDVEPLLENLLRPFLLHYVRRLFRRGIHD